MEGESQAPAIGPIHRRRELQIEEFPRGQVSRLHLELVANGLGQDILLPVLVARGRQEGPVFGLTAAVHGNELNGIRVIHDFVQRLDPEQLSGTLVAVVVVNLRGLQ